jgi:class 3 adenylate cyclase
MRAPWAGWCSIGIHAGASIAVTLNEHLDYFGQTVNIAARIQNLAEGDEICISDDVYAAPSVRDMLAPFATSGTIAELKGVNEKISVYRIAPSQPAGAACPAMWAGSCARSARRQ